MKISTLIPAFAPAAKAPPNRFGAFMRWCLTGSLPVLLVAGIISASFGVLEVASAFILGFIVDLALGSDPGSFFVENWGILAALTVFFLILRPALAGVNAATTAVIVGPNLLPLVLSRLHRHTMGQAVPFFDNDFAGRIAQKQMQTARAVTDVVTELINVVSFALATLIGATIMLAAIDLRVGGLLAVWLVLYLTYLRVMLLRVRARSKARAAARAAVTGVVVDTITNIKTVKLFASSAHEDQAALRSMADFREKALAFGVLSAWFRFGLIGIAGLLPVLLIGTSLYFWSHGSVSPGDIAATGAISLRIGQMTGWVSFTLMALYSNIGEIEDGMATLSPAHALTDRPNATVLKSAAGAVQFETVGFRYGRKSGGLTQFDLSISPGEKIALVGQSGAGKSTVVSLLLRLYDPETGQITLDGRDLRDVTQESLRQQIATVTQETAMFNRSARDNILYGRPDARPEALEAAARQACAHDFILGLEDHQGRKGYDAHLGERGVKLSGGQRQRIALARAILKDAPILVLDEATSALDSETEADVQSALEGLMEGRTVIAIAHRLSTIAAMDRIIVLENGHILEQGRHDDLLQKNGRYAQFWAHQSGGFLRLDAAE